MNKIRIMEHQGGGQYRVVLHFATPAGNSPAGFAWSALLVASGRNKTVLVVGSGPGQVSQADKDAITAGTIVELETIIAPESGGSNGAAQVAALNDMADKRISQYTSELASILKYYGTVVG